MMGKVSIKPDQTYDVWLVSGRILTKRKRVVTHHLDGNELYLALKDTLSSFVGEQVLALPAVRMAMNQVEVSPNAQDLLAVRDFLLAHPEIFVEVGAYVHSGSRLSKGTAIAKQRAHNVKEALTRMGIDENRINVASPEHDGELVNTCGAEPDCREEDLALNGKVEFRITRIGL